ncbi:MAG: hypothetical protein AB7L66_01635 [Gemmatimonadales bacterium]
MPIAFRIDASAGLVSSRATGELLDGDLLDHQRRLREHPDFAPHLNQLFDLRGATAARLSTAAIRTLAERNPFGAGARRAFLVDSRLMFGMMRMYQILTAEMPDSLQVVFEDEAAARRWLGLDPERALDAGG